MSRHDPPFDLKTIETSVGVSFSSLIQLISKREGSETDPRLKYLINLIGRAVRWDQDFISRHPEALFQCLWNRCWWHDAPEALEFFEVPEGPNNPWNSSGPRLSDWAETWRKEFESRPGATWVRSRRPLPERLEREGLVLPISTENMVFSPDGRFLVTAPTRQSPFFHVWEKETGRQVSSWEVPEEETLPRALAISPDGNWIAASTGGRLTLWPLSGKGDPVESVADHGDEIVELVFLPHKNTVVSADLGGRIIFWNGMHGTEQMAIDAHQSSLSTLAISPDGERLLSLGTEGRLAMWETSTGQLLRETTLNDLGSTPSLKWTPDGTRVALTTMDQTLILDAFKLIVEKKGAGFSESLWLDKEALLGVRVSGSETLTLQRWDLKQQDPSNSYQVVVPDPLGRLLISPGGASLAWACPTSRVWLVPWKNVPANPAPKKLPGSLIPPAVGNRRMVFVENDGGLAVLDGDGRRLRSVPIESAAPNPEEPAGEKMVIERFDSVPSSTVGEPFLFNRIILNDAETHALGSVARVGDGETALISVNLENGAQGPLKHLPERLSEEMAPAPGLWVAGDRIAAPLRDGRLAFFEATTSRLEVVKGHTRPISYGRRWGTDRLLTSDGNVLDRVSDVSLILWDLAQGRRLFEGKCRGPNPVWALSADGERMATARQDGTVHLDSLTERKTIDVVRAPDPAGCMCFLDGNRLVVGTRKGLWCLEIGTQKSVPLLESAKKCRALASHPLGLLILVPGRLILWDLVKSRPAQQWDVPFDFLEIPSPLQRIWAIPQKGETLYLDSESLSPRNYFPETDVVEPVAFHRFTTVHSPSTIVSLEGEITRR
jgi:WD40 repeat protein